MMQHSQAKSINQTKAQGQSITELKQIPLLDMQDENFGAQLIENFKKIGFVIIKNHGIPKETIDEAFGTAREVFQLSSQQKIATGLVADQERNRGYTGPGGQVLDEQSKGNEKKETFDLGHPDGPDQLRFYPKNEKFIGISRTMYDELFKVHKKVLTAMQKGLKLEQGFITKKCCKDFHQQTIRYLYYPQVTPQELHKTGKTRAGAHSDYGTITLLFQKPGFGQNGLCALNSQKHWVKVNPPDYTMVINLGDLFQHWTNDVLKSTIHKVEVDDQIYEKLEKKQLTKVPERQTIVMFCDPDHGEIFGCLPGFGEPKYEPIDGKKYVMGRISATYTVMK